MKNEEARVHFIPTLKDGVFVTLCAPLVIEKISIRKLREFRKKEGALRNLNNRVKKSWRKRIQIKLSYAA
ncbi:hypothetical protein [Methanosarcina mazei]|uniref:Uncharacterized protein n=1 Tax=Methanosarcina mazei TaxID=2209 RepID=A0A4P8R493_METMZ|nr:hypothetical protein [Methanosarcina mazei]QCR15705.1 hypothetical protein DKM28_06195 [Methanosarcina mazei]